MVFPCPRSLAAIVRGAIETGSVAFGITWGVAVIASIGLATTDGEGSQDAATVLWIPVAGPLLANTAGTTDGVLVATALWTLAQSAGVAWAQMDLDRGLAAFQGLEVGIGGDEVHTVHSQLHHAINCIPTATA